MKGLAMYYTIKTLRDRGKSIRGIGRELMIDRKTVQRILRQIESKDGCIEVPRIERKSRCDTVKDEIKEWLGKGLSIQLIHERLMCRTQCDISYSGLRNYVRKHYGSPGEVYVPVELSAGEEAQVDFGYMGRFKDERGKWVKVWVFACVLSNSRYAYYELVTDQRVETFIKCHENAFRFFGGVPQVVRIDNLKAGVLEVNFYEPIYQHDYHHFLAHYGASGITCRVRRGQDKGKVEAGVKYVKNNFLKGCETQILTEAKPQLSEWNCRKNKRKHGTTQRIPEHVFNTLEKKELLRLPSQSYAIYRCEKRRVSQYGHIAYHYNYYSVPYHLVGRDVYAKSDGSILRIFVETEEVACHPISKDKGKYITIDTHKMDFKQHKSAQFYFTKALGMGTDVYQFLVQLHSKRPSQWTRMGSGVMTLADTYGNDAVNASCRRAIAYGALSFQSVKQICERRLYVLDDTPITAVNNDSGFASDLSLYDTLTGATS